MAPGINGANHDQVMDMNAAPPSGSAVAIVADDVRRRSLRTQGASVSLPRRLQFGMAFRCVVGGAVVIAAAMFNLHAVEADLILHRGRVVTVDPAVI